MFLFCIFQEPFVLGNYYIPILQDEAIETWKSYLREGTQLVAELK